MAAEMPKDGDPNAGLRPRRDCAVTTALLVIGVLAASGPLRPSSARSADETRRAACYAPLEARDLLLRSQIRINSFHALYLGYGAPEPGSPAGLYVRRKIFAKAPCRLLYHAAHGYEGLAWQDDVLQQRLFVVPGRFYNEFPLRRVFTEGSHPSDAAPPGTAQDELLFELTGWWPFDSRPAPRPYGRVHALRDVALSDCYCRVRQCQEPVGERWRHVLEFPGVDCLWLDMDRGACLMARALRDPATGELITSVTLGEHRELAPGVWCPSTIRSIHYDFRAGTAEARRRKVTDARITVLSMSVNDVDEAVFEFHPVAGSLSQSLDKPRSPLKQCKAGGLEYLDVVAAWIARNDPPSEPSFDERFAGYACLASLPSLIVVVWLHFKNRVRENRVTSHA